MKRQMFPAWAGAHAAATGLAFLTLGTGPAAAEGCLEQVRQLAARHGRSIDPPALSPGSPQPTDPPGATPDGQVDLTALQALRVAAKDQAERGREAGCVKRLATARELGARAP